jgi:hypothetical protein
VEIIYPLCFATTCFGLFYGVHQVVLQTYKKGKCFSGRGLPFTDNEYRISIILLLRVFQISGLIIVIKYGLEIIKSTCAAEIRFYACKCHLFFETLCVVDRGGSAFIHVDT